MILRTFSIGKKCTSSKENDFYKTNLIINKQKYRHLKTKN